MAQATADAVEERLVLFSEHFGIHRRQQDLEFVDIPLDTDVLLYVDPYAFKINDGDWYVACNNLVVDFFQRVVDGIRAGRTLEVRNLLNQLSEPNGTHFGHSQGRPTGRGVGRLQAEALYERLSESKAITSGWLHDLADCELLIHGISNDKISDITTNVVNRKLIEFTQAQCRQWSVPMTEKPSGPYWCAEEGFWKSERVELPTYGGQPIILVPKSVVRRKMAIDHGEYWRKFQTEHLQMEHLSLNSSLCRVIRSGKRKGEVLPPRKKDLKGELPCQKDATFDYTQKHPELLQKYKDHAATKRSEPTADDLLAAVESAARKSGKTLENSPEGISITIVQEASGKVVNHNTTNVHGDVVGGVIGGGVVNARDIAVYRQTVEKEPHLEPDVREALLKARETAETVGLPTASKNDVADSVGVLTQELAKPERDAGRIRQVLTRIQAAAPTVFHVLKSVEVIGKFFTGDDPSASN